MDNKTHVSVCIYWRKHKYYVCMECLLYVKLLAIIHLSRKQGHIAVYVPRPLRSLQ